MFTHQAPDREGSRGSHFPHWATPVLLTILFLGVHVVAPWGLSQLSARYGWTKERPGLWNTLALIPIGIGIAGTLWMITLHYRVSPGTFLELKQSRTLITPGPYAISRNPMYLCELLFWFGWALFYGSIAVFVGFLFFAVILNFVILPYEERDLEVRFGEAYRQYKLNVPRWLGKSKP